MIHAITPIDGRYHSKTESLARYFSEFALIRYRMRVEIAYLQMLADENILDASSQEVETLTTLWESFGPDQAKRVKDIEAVTNHDVKAVEYFIREKMEDLGLGKWVEFVHFGLTSQDVNNTAIPLSIKEACDEVMLPAIRRVVDKLYSLASEWRDIPMLAHTHGQPASPTRLGKELMVFVERLNRQLAMLEQVPYSAKFGGATGNFNAHYAAFPEVDWIDFGDRFCERLGLKRVHFTTQIEHYDMLAAHFQGLNRIFTICIDLCRDLWTYISMDYFRQKVIAGEVGSSAMPHKVNPIDFENAEGNLGLAIAVGEHLALKLPVSRLQRDLTDSTVLRNGGLPYAYGLIAMQSLLKGLGKLIVNEEHIKEDLDRNWSVLAEPIQTILRREGYPDPYNVLKQLTRGQATINRDSILTFIDGLTVSKKVKDELRMLRPETYLGKNPDF